MFTNRAHMGYVLVFVIGWSMCVTARADTAQVSEIIFDVAVRTGSATIHATVFSNPHRCAHGMTVLGVPGGGGTSYQLGPLASAIFSDAHLGGEIARIVAIDPPGHGNSSFPMDCSLAMCCSKTKPTCCCSRSTSCEP